MVICKEFILIIIHDNNKFIKNCVLLILMFESINGLIIVKINLSVISLVKLKLNFF